MSHIPRTRRVAVASSPGNPGEVIDIVTEPVTSPGPGQLLVKVTAAAVNHSENLALQGGAYAAKLTFPQRLGYEGAGIVAAAGPETSISPGTAVAFLNFSGGGCADHTTVSESTTVPLPTGLAAESAARVVSAGLTAQLLTRVRDLATGSAAIWAAAGPVGRMLTAFLTESGTTVVGIASGDRVDAVSAAGATAAIDRTQSDVVSAMRETTGGRGVDTVFDPIGEPTYRRSLDMLAVRGLYVSFGQISGRLPHVDLMDLMERGVQVTKAGGGSAFTNGFGEIPDLLTAAVAMAARRPATISELGGRFTLDHTADGYRALASGATGKVLITF